MSFECPDGDRQFRHHFVGERVFERPQGDGFKLMTRVTVKRIVWILMLRHLLEGGRSKELQQRESLLESKHVGTETDKLEQQQRSYLEMKALDSNQ